MNNIYLALIFYKFLENKGKTNKNYQFSNLNIYNMEAAFEHINNSEDFKGIFNHLKFNTYEVELSIDKIKEDQDKYLTMKDWFNSAIDFMYNKNILSESLSSDLLKRVIEGLLLSELKENIKAYDPALGSGSLLINFNKYAEFDYYGEEISEEAFNLARMNFLINEINNFNIKLSDCITNNNFKSIKFDLIVTEPPFDREELIDEKLLNDLRFKAYKNESIRAISDYKYILHSLSSLNDKGKMAVVVPPRILFSEIGKKIRKELIESKNYLDAVITFPESILVNSSISISILIFTKNRNKKDDILFLNTASFFIKKYRENTLSEESIKEISNIYNKRLKIKETSKLVNLKEIKENDYNLNINRYIKTDNLKERRTNKELIEENTLLKSKIQTKSKTIDDLIKKLNNK